MSERSRYPLMTLLVQISLSSSVGDQRIVFANFGKKNTVCQDLRLSPKAKREFRYL